MNLLRTSWGQSSTEPLRSEILLLAELLSERKNKIICVQKKNIYTDSSTLQFDFKIMWKFRGSSLKHDFWVSDDFELIVNWFWEHEYIIIVVVLEVWGLLLGFRWSWEHEFIYLFIIVGVVEELGICMSDNLWFCAIQVKAKSQACGLSVRQRIEEDQGVKLIVFCTRPSVRKLYWLYCFWAECFFTSLLTYGAFTISEEGKLVITDAPQTSLYKTGLQPLLIGFLVFG